MNNENKYRNELLYGDAIYIITYETAYSIGRFVLIYKQLMTDTRLNKKIEKLLSQKDIIHVNRRFVTVDEWKNVISMEAKFPNVVEDSDIEYKDI